MAVNRLPRRQAHRILEGWASLLVILLLGWTAGLWAGAPNPEDLPPARRAPRVHVEVHQGRLSVDLWEADVEEVFDQIRQQAGVPITGSPSATETISLQFTGLALEEGLRRVLQRASRSYAMRYAPDRAGGVVMREVHVLGRTRAEGPDPLVAERAVGAPMIEAGQRFVEAFRQPQAAGPPVAREEASDGGSRFREALKHRAEPVPWPTAEHESAAVHRFQEALEGFTNGTQR